MENHLSKLRVEVKIESKNFLACRLIHWIKNENGGGRRIEFSFESMYPHLKTGTLARCSFVQSIHLKRTVRISLLFLSILPIFHALSGSRTCFCRILSASRAFLSQCHHLSPTFQFHSPHLTIPIPTYTWIAPSFSWDQPFNLMEQTHQVYNRA